MFVYSGECVYIILKKPHGGGRNLLHVKSDAPTSSPAARAVCDKETDVLPSPALRFNIR